MPRTWDTTTTAVLRLPSGRGVGSLLLVGRESGVGYVEGTQVGQCEWSHEALSGIDGVQVVAVSAASRCRRSSRLARISLSR